MRVIAKSMVIAAAVGAFGALAATLGAASSPQLSSSPQSTVHGGYAIGEIKQIDTERGAIILKHGPIENLGMPDMTMIFWLTKRDQAAGLKVGDLVRFRAQKVQGQLFVTELLAFR